MVNGEVLRATMVLVESAKGHLCVGAIPMVRNPMNGQAGGTFDLFRVVLGRYAGRI